MYGTVFRMKALPGKEKELVELFETWEKERRPKASGAVASYMLKSEKEAGEFLGVAVFTDKASYRANAEDPEQDKWYQQVRRLLRDDPEWNDGEYVFGRMP